jgi:hypothetical protein
MALSDFKAGGLGVEDDLAHALSCWRVIVTHAAMPRKRHRPQQTNARHGSDDRGRGRHRGPQPRPAGPLLTSVRGGSARAALAPVTS